MFNCIGSRLPNSHLGKVSPIETLYEWDCQPLMFVAEGKDGQKILLHNMDISFYSEMYQYCAVKIDDETIDQIKNNEISLCDALDQHDHNCYIVNTDEKHQIKSLYQVKFYQIPGDYLPSRGVKLHPDESFSE
jgi:hypothetical protein